MTSKFTHIEYRDCNDGKWKTHPVTKVSCLAIVSIKQPPETRTWCGPNLCIALPHNNLEEEHELRDRIWKDVFEGKADKFMVYVCNQDGVKIPVSSCNGNGYDENLGTSCLFGYIGEDIFDLHLE
tara:strand:- start:836 stop:1210 length:375 start_codon:yes stop_codon:yes gene_type:complete